MRIDVVTLFPEFFDSPLRAGVLSRAVQRGLVSFRFANPRDFTRDRHRTVDDTPDGGGPGMILRPEPVVEAVESLTEPGNPRAVPVVLLSPQGNVLTQAKVAELAQLGEVLFLCGRYKALDERVRQLVVTEELSVGDYVLSGGEPGCLAVVDAVVRLLPGVLGDLDSAASDSFSPGWNGGLDCAYYTRPAEYRGLQVPEVLLSGHHARIAAWRRAEAQRRTQERRPDLQDERELPNARTGGSDAQSPAPPTQGRNAG